MGAAFHASPVSPTASPRPLLLLEINEVPWRVVDFARRQSRLTNVRRFFDRAATFTTMSGDTGELSPWVTWPSLHRGMNNEEHGIKHLGQDVESFRGAAIWEEYRDAGLSVGICGSMQSWPPVDPGRGGFYVPDTFAHDERCIPSRVEALQRFNLQQVRSNGRVVKRSSKLNEGIDLLKGAVSAGVRPRTFAALAKQLAFERLQPARVTRRPILQSQLFWDTFLSLYDAAAPPAFATFFTNHVASAMHRFWRDLFPEDFDDRSPRSDEHRGTLLAALDVLDEILGDALALQERSPELLLVFASSMGQAAVRRDGNGFEAVVRTLPALVRAAGLADSDVELRLAMVPQVSVAVADETKRARLIAFLEGARVESHALFDVDVIGTSLSITIRTPDLAGVRGGTFTVDGRTLRFADAGIEMLEVESGTGYHVPEGVMAIVGRGIAADDARTELPLASVKERLLELTGLHPTSRSATLASEARSGSATAPARAPRAASSVGAV